MAEQLSEQDLNDQLIREEEDRSTANSLRLVVGSAAILIAIATIFYHYVESLSWLNSLYFTVITMATVGYGDITPKTGAGKIFTMLLVIAGISVFVRAAQVVSQALGTNRRKRVAIRVARRKAKRDH